MNVLTIPAVQGAACGLMIGAVVLVGRHVWRPATVAAQTPAVPAVVRARRFELVDAAGKTRAGLSVNSDGSPNMALFDATGNMRAGLFVLPEKSPHLLLRDAAGKVIWEAP